VHKPLPWWSIHSDIFQRTVIARHRRRLVVLLPLVVQLDLAEVRRQCRRAYAVLVTVTVQPRNVTVDHRINGEAQSS
jgi:hypothetical protein